MLVLYKYRLFLLLVWNILVICHIFKTGIPLEHFREIKLNKPEDVCFFLVMIMWKECAANDGREANAF